MLLNCGVAEYSWESLELQGDQTSQSYRKSVLNIHWKDWWWSWSSNVLATWCEELTHWKRPWCWEILKAGGEIHNRGWGGRMASLIRWAWVWASSGSWWWTRKPGLLQYLGFQSPWTRLSDWTELNCFCFMNSDRFWYWQNICYSCPSCLCVLLAFLTSDLDMLLLLFNATWVKLICPIFQQKFFEVLCDSTILLSSLLWAWWHPR